MSEECVNLSSFLDNHDMSVDDIDALKRIIRKYDIIGVSKRSMGNGAWKFTVTTDGLNRTCITDYLTIPTVDDGGENCYVESWKKEKQYNERR